MLFLFFVIMMTFAACGHEHIFGDATCTTPKTCAECGETTGEANGHRWSDANCVDPQICSECGNVNGEPLGHLLEVGKCPRCGVIVNEEVILKVKKYIDSMSDANLNAMAYADLIDTSSLASTYLCILYADGELEDAKEVLDDLVDLCKKYDDLTSIKDSAQDALEAIPNQIAGSDVDSIVAWLNAFADYMDECADLGITFADYLKTLQ